MERETRKLHIANSTPNLSSECKSVIHGVNGLIFVSERQYFFVSLSPVSRPFGEAPGRVKNKIAGQNNG